MELDRPYLRSSSSTNNANNSELFICFASRLSSSSSSMKIAKSILSPGHAARDTPISLSNSLSRRLRANGSIKGGQASPMFPSVSRKKGCNFENPEPSSPKVTCIGQVRVKSKKKGSQTRSLSKRRSAEVSFRKAEQAHDAVSVKNVQQCLPERNQRWVHFPVTICEALRAVGAEISCLFPCRSPCFSTREKEEQSEGRDERNGENQSSCGAVFTRWFVSVQDCEGRQARQIELVVGGGDEERTEVVERRSMRSSRRHVFEDIEFNKERFELKAEGEEEEEKGRVSICIPPKNALLLMRCRSDPMKMAALTNRSLEFPASKDEEDDEEKGDDEEEIPRKDVQEEVILQEFSQIINKTKQVVNEKDKKPQNFVSTEDDKGFDNHDEDGNLAMEMQSQHSLTIGDKTGFDNLEKDANLTMEIQSQHFVPTEDNKGFDNLEKDANLAMEMHESKEGTSDDKSNCNGESQQIQLEQALIKTGEVTAAILPPFEVQAAQEKAENMENEAIEATGENESDKSETDASQAAALDELQENEGKTDGSSVEERIKDPILQSDEEKQTTTHLEFQEDDSEDEAEDEENDRQESTIAQKEDKDGSFAETKKIDKESSTASPPPPKGLPDCLLLMMCEPKLSMDMSEETWVCSTDFIRWLPERLVKKVNNEPKKRNSTDSNPLQLPPKDSKAQKKQQQMMQPPRSSCSLPAAAAASMATMIEQKLVNAVGYEPFVLKRCKSEPMRTAAAKLVPEACCWKDRKLEPHRRAAFGVGGAAGLGF